MRLSLSPLLAGLCCLAFLPTILHAAVPIQGRVVDEAGRPLARVAWQISGTENWNGGRWIRVILLHDPRDNFTDGQGRFTLNIPDGAHYKLLFHRPGFAPAFVFEVAANAPELKITLKPGQRLHGTVTHRSNGKLEPVKGETVELRLPSSDVWYQESTVTDEKGGYEFQVCPPPPEPSLTRDPPFKPQWQVVQAGRMVPVEVRAGEAVKPVDFEIGAALTPP